MKSPLNVSMLCALGLVSMAPLAVQQGQANSVPVGSGVVDAGSPVLAMASFEPPVAFQLLKVQTELVRGAEATYRGARVVATLPGWQRAVRDVERMTGLPWRGLAPAIVMIPDGGRGFECEGNRDGCLGRYQGVTMLVQQGADSGMTTLVSVILIAESARGRPDVWMHELTHAVLNQHGLSAESARHDRRFFAESHFVRVEF